MFQSQPDWFAFYPRVWLTSRAVMAMAPQAKAGYLALLCHSWLSNTCSIPSGDEELAVLSGLGNSWSKYGTEVRNCFVNNPNCEGELINERLFKERVVSERIIQSKRAAGIKSGEARRKKKAAGLNRRSNNCSTYARTELEHKSNDT